MVLALALAITRRARRAILSLPWTVQHQSNTRNTATGFTWHPFVVARWIRVYSSRCQSTAPLSILPKVVEKTLRLAKDLLTSCTVKQRWAPRNADSSLASVYAQLITSMAYAVRLRFSIAAPRGLNVRSLVAKLPDVISDNRLMSAGILCFCETWLNPSQLSLVLKNDMVDIRCDRLTCENKGGVIMYVPSQMHPTNLHRFATNGIEAVPATLELPNGSHIQVALLQGYQKFGFCPSNRIF